MDFPTIMVLLVALTGVIWAIDAALLAPKRRLAAANVPEEADSEEEYHARALALQPPKLVEYARSFFPVFLIVLVLRSFIVEPFRIPSGSMMPTLLVGDFILVNKFDYGIRLPVTDTKIIDIGTPKRGDVIVFRYPEDPSIPFIKRVVGLPGDVIVYDGKKLYINGKLVSEKPIGTYKGHGSGISMTGAEVFMEHMGHHTHKILEEPEYPSPQGRIVVPPHSYFVMGDNRDDSRDSRYWGTVPDKNLIGRAFLIWMNWDWGHGIDLSRVGKPIS